MVMSQQSFRELIQEVVGLLERTCSGSMTVLCFCHLILSVLSLQWAFLAICSELSLVF